MKIILLVLVISGCEYFEKPTFNGVSLGQHQRDIAALEYKINELESEISRMKRDISDLEYQ